MPRRFELLVFDWDGTLIDSTGAIVACIQEAARDLGLAVPDDQRARHVIGLGLSDALAYAVPDLPVSDYGRMAERYRYHFLARDAGLPLFAGSRELLDSLRARGHRLAIATGKSRAGLARALGQLDMAGIFAATRCADQCPPKPAPDMLIELMDEIGTTAERTLMIGDTAHDLVMAANAGVAAVAVGYGAHPPEELATLGPLALARSTAELAAWLDENA
jgi:phosphoglycolate phosphatase